MSQPRTKFLSLASLTQAIWTSKLSFCAGDKTCPLPKIGIEEGAAFSSVDEPTLVLVRTYAHTPADAPTIKRRGSGLSFPAFRVFRIAPDTEPVEVVRSHWKGSIEDGEFCDRHGRISGDLGRMIMLLASRYSRKGNWAGYSYREELESAAVEALLTGLLKFDVTRVSANGQVNSFAYATQTMKNAMLRVLKIEKAQRDIRDDLLIEAGMTPSLSRQLDDD